MRRIALAAFALVIMCGCSAGRIVTDIKSDDDGDLIFTRCTLASGAFGLEIKDCEKIPIKPKKNGSN